MDDKRIITKSMRVRASWILVFATLCFAVIVGSLFNIQLLSHDKLKGMANQAQLSSLLISANRGAIYDRDMNILAQSATAWTVVVDPTNTKSADCEKLAAALADILGIDYESTLAKCKAETQYSIIARKVEEKTCDKIRQWTADNSVNSISFVEDPKRYYPNGNLLSTVLGFTGTDNYGLYGLEAYFDNTLAGVSGRVMTARNAQGGSVYYEYEKYYDPKQGDSLVLTIDETVQYYLEKYIEETMELYKVKNYAAGIVLNIKTGEILGITSKPDYDPNNAFSVLSEALLQEINSIDDTEKREEAYTAAMYEQWTNKAISSAYFPGSVFKAITASMALETGVATVSDQFDCQGSLNVSGVTIGCNNRAAHGLQSFAEIVIHSCNVSFMKLGEKLGSQTFFDYFKAFGLTEKTGVDLPAEGSSIYYTAENLGPVELATSAFGQSNAITPLQMITAFGAAVNGGNLLKPYIVSKIVDEDGGIVLENKTTVKRQVISAETSATIAEILRETATNYSSQNAYVKGYRVGGKSGTSEKQGGADDEYIASFCGFAPAEDPEIAILVVFDNPRGSSYYGGIVAAPCVGKILASILPHLGIDPVYSEDELTTIDVAVVDVRSQNVENAKSQLTNAGFSAKIVGGGDTVTSQFPSAGLAVPKGSTIVLYTDSSDQPMVTMPNLIGKTYKNAAAALAECSLNIRINGATSSSAVVSSQSQYAGESLPMGTIITIQLTDYSLID